MIRSTPRRARTAAVLVASVALSWALPGAAMSRPVEAPPPSADATWSRIRQLQRSQMVQVVVDGLTIRGRFQAADDTSLVVVVKGAPQTIERERVEQVALAHKSRRGRRTWIGVGLGMVVGMVATGVHCRNHDDSCKEVMPVVALPSAAAGGAVGALWPRRTRWEVIYRRAPA